MQFSLFHKPSLAKCPLYGGVSGPTRRPVIKRRTSVEVKVLYKTPSGQTASTELEALASFSEIVPDTILMQSLQDLEQPKAATSSSLVLSGILRNSSGLREYEVAIERALQFDVCQAETGEEKLACELDKALVNLGSLFAKEVQGRVSTEVDPRVARDTEKIMSRAKNLVGMYTDMGVPLSKVLIRIPATWEGIQAAKQLEEMGVSTHMILVYSFAQAQAAAQAGVSVIQPSIGRLGDWYKQHPGFIRDPKGPREDTGFASSVKPGVILATKIYNYCTKYYRKSTVMISGIRQKEDALALAGAPFLVIGPKVLSALGTSPTLQGYNDGLHVSDAALEESVPRMLSPEGAAAAEFSAEETAPLTQATFYEGLGTAGKDLLAEGLAGLVADTERLLPDFAQRTIGTF